MINVSFYIFVKLITSYTTDREGRGSYQSGATSQEVFGGIRVQSQGHADGQQVPGSILAR